MAFNNKYFLSFTIFFTVAPIIIYFFFIVTYGVNAPWFDEIKVSLSFLRAVNEAKSEESFYAAFFNQHNENRLVLNHLVYFTQYKTLGELNFLHQMLLGNIFFIFVFSFHIYQINRIKTLSNNVKFILIASCSLIMFSPVSTRVMFWALNSLAGVGGLLFSYLCIYYFWKSGYLAAVKALIFFTVSLYTNSSALFLLPSLVICCLYDMALRGSISNAALKQRLLFLCASCVVVFIYFIDLIPSRSLAGQLETQLNDIYYFLLNILVLLGSGFSFLNPNIAVFFGLILLSVFLYIVYKVTKEKKLEGSGIDQDEAVLLSLLLLIFVGYIVIAIMRGVPGRPSSVLNAYYSYYSLYCVVPCIILLVKNHTSTLVQARAIMLFFVGSLVFYSATVMQQSTKMVEQCRLDKKYLYSFQERLVKEGDLGGQNELLAAGLSKGYVISRPWLKESYWLPDRFVCSYL